MFPVSELSRALLHLAFPHVCEGCGDDRLQSGQYLCLPCQSELPLTHFHCYPSNPIEKLFWGRLQLVSATAHFYFSDGSLIQRLMHAFKYRQAQDLGFYLGMLMGTALVQSNRFATIDALLPLPLHPAKERKRGFNQATILCEGMATTMNKPVLKRAVLRKDDTETQTKKTRVGRWLNMEGGFIVTDVAAIQNKHLLLVDDVVTTGATLEACGKSILQIMDTSLSIATLCHASRL